MIEFLSIIDKKTPLTWMRSQCSWWNFKSMSVQGVSDLITQPGLN